MYKIRQTYKIKNAICLRPTYLRNDGYRFFGATLMSRAYQSFHRLRNFSMYQIRQPGSDAMRERDDRLSQRAEENPFRAVGSTGII